jgi:16S rRNA (cytosine1402-N4)-methyltransferase
MTTPGRSRSSASDPGHAPVLVAETLALLVPRASGVYVDCTVGLGGHTAALLESGAGRVIGLDRDPSALTRTATRLGDADGRLTLVHADYRELSAVLAARGLRTVDGVMADLGVSSMQLDDPTRGFSFRAAGPLDMRMDPTHGAPLGDRLRDVTADELADVIFQLGEERHSRKVARAILAARDAGALTDTAALASVVRRAAGGRGWQRLDPATRTFQALRIWVNRELDGLDSFLAEALAALRPGGRLAVIAFHSLEDRIVKHTFRRLAADGAGVLVTRRPIVPADEEIERNPRARSARLRAMEKAA